MVRFAETRYHVHFSEFQMRFAFYETIELLEAEYLCKDQDFIFNKTIELYIFKADNLC